MKRFLLTVCCLMGAFAIRAQVPAQFSSTTTVYETYQPAWITLSSGKTIFQKEANVHLKNGRLLFKKGNLDMAANMEQIRSVRFADRQYVRLNDMLATIIDTIGQNKVLYTTTIDMEAYGRKALNDQVISSLDIGDQVSVTHIDVSSDEERYPLVNHFYLEVDGKVIEVHERTIQRHLPKEKKDLLKSYMEMPDFNWSDPKYLHLILQLFTE